jgi:hypothetical protein
MLSFADYRPMLSAAMLTACVASVSCWCPDFSLANCAWPGLETTGSFSPAGSQSHAREEMETLLFQAGHGIWVTMAQLTL